MNSVESAHESVQDRVVELLIAANTEFEDQARIDCLIQIQELIIHREPALLDNFLDEVTTFQHDRAIEVRKTVIGIIEEACKKDNDLLTKVIKNLQFLLSDNAVAVQKRVIQAMTQLYRVMLLWLSRAHAITDAMESAWNTLCDMKTQVAKMIDHDNDGVRTLVVKFYEMIVISQTYPKHDSVRKEAEFSLEEVPLNLKVARPSKLEDEARQMFEDLLKFHGSAHISSANLMACMGSLTHIAKSRPQFMEKIIVAMEMLHANLPPTLSKSQVSSVRKHLKLQLLSILKHPAAYEYSDDIKTLLGDLGATQHEINKAMPTPEELAKYPKRTEKPDSRIASGPALKKRKVEVEDDVPEPKYSLSKDAAMDISEQFILQRLTPKVAAEIVLATLPYVTDVMPAHFTSTYTPIAAAGSQAQVKHVAHLLAAHLAAAGIGNYIDKQKHDFDGEEERVDDQIPSESASLKLRSIGDVDQQKQSGVGSQFIQAKVKPRLMKLSEITKPLAPHMGDTMALMALHRVLNADRTAILGGVATMRQKILTSLGSLFHLDFKEPLIEYIMKEPRSRIELALSWLYEEYLWISGFCQPAFSFSDECHKAAANNYSIAFCSLVESLRNQSDLKDRDTLLNRLYLESPLIPEKGVLLLRSLCEDATSVAIAIEIVRHLVHRPNKQLIFLNVLLEVSSHEDEEIRKSTISCLAELYNRGELHRVIEEYAVMYLKFLLLSEPPALLAGPEKGRNYAITVWTEEIIKACLYLFLALLPSNEKLIHELATVYVQSNADIKRTILRVIENPVKGMGMESPELLKLVETCPKGAETLVTRIIHILTDKSPPSVELVDHVRDLYHKRVPDVRFLIPVLNGLTKKEVLTALPKLIKLNPDVVKKVFSRLLGIQGESVAGYPCPLTPPELLIALHNIESSKCDMKIIMKATSMCFSERSVYTQEVLAVVMQQLMEQNPLPTLFMRTVLQSLTLYPRLSGFVMNILQRLIVKQVWKQKKVWEGFIKCCQRTKPQSFGVLLQLPPKYLQDVLNSSPELKEPLLAHAVAITENQRLHIPKLIMDVLNGVAHFQAELEEPTQEEPTQEVTSPESMDTSSQLDVEPPAPGEQ